MKALLPLLFFALCVLAGSVRAQQPAPLAAPAAPAPPDDFNPDGKPGAVGDASPGKFKYILIMPEEKVPEKVKTAERNPFGKIREEHETATKGTTEENNIRGKMEKLHVVGVSSGPNGPRVMLGDMVLEAGKDVPPVLPDQTMKLRVGRINEQSIELVWIEKKATGMPERLLTLPADLRPYVHFALPGQPPAKPASDKSTSKKGLTMGTELVPVDDLPSTNTSKLGDSAKLEKSAVHFDPPAPSKFPESNALGAPAPTTPNLQPEGWQRGVGFLNDLTKLEDAKK